MTRARRVDAHHHVWDLDARPQPWTDGLPALRRSFGFDELRNSLRDNAIAGTILVHTVASRAETDELIDLAATTPEILGVVGWFDLEGPALDDDLWAAKGRPGGDRLVGARHQLQTEPDQEWLGRPSVARGLRTLARHGLAYDVVVSPGQLPLVAQVACDLDDLRFVLDHAGKPALTSGDLASWRRDLSVLAGCANVAVKLSGLVTEAGDDWSVDTLRPAADHVLQEFSPARTMFGSDWPVCLLAASYAHVVEAAEELLAGLSPSEAVDVWGGTAGRWYAG